MIKTTTIESANSNVMMSRLLKIIQVVERLGTRILAERKFANDFSVSEFY
jgi:hypothetical protein